MAGRSKKSWCVYMVRCSDGTLYCGATNDIASRIEAHDSGRGARYTRGRGPVHLVYRVPMPSRSAALREEARLKRLGRAEKQRVIAEAPFDIRRPGRIFRLRERWGDAMPKWDEIQKHANKIIAEGVKLLKSGMSEAEYIAEATAASARLHVTVRKDRFDTYKAMHDLGQKVHAAAAKSAGGEVKLTDPMLKLIKRVNSLERDAKAAEAKIAKLTVTKKGGAKPKRARRSSGNRPS